jgi:uncharacterized protein YeaO (DUF488 family)
MPRQAMRCGAGTPHDQKKWPTFRARYLTELQQNPAAAELREKAREAKTVTLLFAAKDAERNNAIVLREFLGGGAAGKEN